MKSTNIDPPMNYDDSTISAQGSALPIIPGWFVIMGTPFVMIGIPMLLGATAVDAIPITGIPKTRI